MIQLVIQQTARVILYPHLYPELMTLPPLPTEPGNFFMLFLYSAQLQYHEIQEICRIPLALHRVHKTSTDMLHYWLSKQNLNWVESTEFGYYTTCIFLNFLIKLFYFNLCNSLYDCWHNLCKKYMIIKGLMAHVGSPNSGL